MIMNVLPNFGVKSTAFILGISGLQNIFVMLTRSFERDDSKIAYKVHFL